MKKIAILGSTGSIGTQTLDVVRANGVKMLKFCMKYQVPVVMDSDAHFDTHIAEFDAARVLLEELDFPEELVVNHSVNALRGYINAIK